MSVRALLLMFSSMFVLHFTLVCDSHVVQLKQMLEKASEEWKID
jgi:hypothetical protein